MRPTRRHLLLVPGGLAAGHAVEAMAFGHTSALGGALGRTLLCVGAPMAVWALLVSVHDGWRDRHRPGRPEMLVAQQVVAFVAVDLVDHAVHGSSLVAQVARPGFWASLVVHGAIGLGAGLALRLATRVGRGLAAVPAPATWWPAGPDERWARVVAEATSLVALSSLSRRGPPDAVPASLTA